MQPKEIHDFLFRLYDFADEMANPDIIPPADSKTGFMIMAYIEDIMDVYGRQLISQTAEAAGLDAGQSLKEAHSRIDRLRSKLKVFESSSELHETIDHAARRLKRNYGTRD